MSQWTIRILALGLLLADTGLAATPAGQQEGDWLVLPGSYTGRRVIRAEDAAPVTFRVVLEVGPTPEPGKTVPKVVKSSGTRALDELATEFSRASVAGSDKLRALAQRQTAVFRVEMRAPSGANSSYRVARVGRRRDFGNESYFLPQPPYPMQARKEREEGPGVVRLVWEAGKTRPSYVYLDRSTGSPVLDTNMLQWAISQWERREAGPAESKSFPFRYRLISGSARRPGFIR